MIRIVLAAVFFFALPAWADNESECTQALSDVALYTQNVQNANDLIPGCEEDARREGQNPRTKCANLYRLKREMETNQRRAEAQVRRYCKNRPNT